MRPAVGRTDHDTPKDYWKSLAADDILREADLAMYTAKTTGKSRHVRAGQA